MTNPHWDGFPYSQFPIQLPYSCFNATPSRRPSLVSSRNLSSPCCEIEILSPSVVLLRLSEQKGAIHCNSGPLFGSSNLNLDSGCFMLIFLCWTAPSLASCLKYGTYSVERLELQVESTVPDRARWPKETSCGGGPTDSETGALKMFKHTWCFFEMLTVLLVTSHRYQ